MGLLGFAVPAAALVAVTNSTLQAFGRIDLPLVSMFAGAVVKMLGDYFLIGNPALNIMGAPISTALCYWLIAVINLFHIRRLTGSLPPIGKNGLPSAGGHHRHECGDFHCAARAERCVERSSRHHA